MITESEMQALRELFLECAGSLLESERKQTTEVLRGVEARLGGVETQLDSIERKLDAKEELEKIKERLKRLEEWQTGIVNISG